MLVYVFFFLVLFEKAEKIKTSGAQISLHCGFGLVCYWTRFLELVPLRPNSADLWPHEKPISFLFSFLFFSFFQF